MRNKFRRPCPDPPYVPIISPPPGDSGLLVAVVTGTYNRKAHVLRAIESVRRHGLGRATRFIVVDGGSTDGTQDALRQSSEQNEHDIDVIQQDGELTGAVRAFNLGFARAVDLGARYVMNFNDDAELATPRMIANAIAILDRNPVVGAVAFEFNLRGPYQVERVYGKTYPNFGLTRLHAGISVAIAQGDPTGRAWWNPIYRTYGADTEFGCWLWKLGWTIHDGVGLYVADHNVQDALRQSNHAPGKGPPGRHPDSELFYARWKCPEQLDPSRNLSVP